MMPYSDDLRSSFSSSEATIESLNASLDAASFDAAAEEEEEEEQEEVAAAFVDA